MAQMNDDDLERQQIPEDEWYRQIHGINPMKYAGEGWFATDEYARGEDVDDPWTRGEIGREGEYYPGPDLLRRWRGY